MEVKYPADIGADLYPKLFKPICACECFGMRLTKPEAKLFEQFNCRNAFARSFGESEFMKSTAGDITSTLYLMRKIYQI